MNRKIISVSRRTDIPAFYSQWFMNRIKAGYCTVVNPFNANQVSYVSLKPEDVEVLVFWTRNPGSLMKELPKLDQAGYSYYFQYTVLGYPTEIDPFSPKLSQAIQTFKELSKIIGREKVIWRYDPVLLSNLTDVEWHKKQFADITEALSAYTERVVISVIDPYKKTRSRMQEETSSGFRLSENGFEPKAYRALLESFWQISKNYRIEKQTCAEEADFARWGITPGKCIDDALISRITGRALLLKKDLAQRQACCCVVSKDIGVNNTCLYGCKYCYATRNLKQAKRNYKSHNPESPSLLGWHDAEFPEPPVKSRQLDLYD